MYEHLWAGSPDAAIRRHTVVFVPIIRILAGVTVAAVVATAGRNDDSNNTQDISHSCSPLVREADHADDAEAGEHEAEDSEADHVGRSSSGFSVPTCVSIHADHSSVVIGVISSSTCTDMVPAG